VRKSFLKAFGYCACFAWSFAANAVGFGGINVTSSLGQPLVAEIELVAVDKADKSSLNAHLASPEAFKGAGIDYPYSLPKLKFEVATHPNGVQYIKATTDQVVNEPFVSLLLELTWSSGRLLREYTFLLDPPGFVAEQPPAVAVKPIEPVIESAVAPAPAIAEAAPVAASATLAADTQAAALAPQEAAPVATAAPEASGVAAAEPVETAASAVTAEVAKPVDAKVEPLAKEEPPVADTAAKKQAQNNHAPASPITVKQGDTLSKIANKNKPSDVSLERMLVALYRANAEVFDEHNMNRLRKGKILRLPEADDVAKLNQADAVKEVHAQVADWNEYRQKLAAANAPVAEQRAKQEVAGKISTSIAESAPVAKEPAKEVLKLSKGEDAGDKAATGGKAKTSQDKAAAKEEESIANGKALKDSEQRTAMLEKNVKEMQRLVELKSQAAKAAQDKNGAASAPANAIPLIASSVASASAVNTASGVAETKPKPKTVAPKVVAPPPSLLDELLDNPIYLGGGAAAILGLGGLGFAFSRRLKKAGPGKKQKSEDVGSTTGRIAAPVQSSPETGDFTHTITATPASALDSDEVDPIGEADLFLNFGRDVQAEEVLKEALQKDPSNNPIKLKLLSIYATRKDTKSFSSYAKEVKDSRDEASWAKAAAMGLEIDPNNALYGSGSEPTSETATTVGNPAEAPVDFDLGFTGGEPAVSTLNLGMNKPEVKHEFTGEDTSVLSVDDLRSAQDIPMDFDITSTNPGVKPAAPLADPKFEVSAMDFDVSGSHGGASEKLGLDVPVMDFDVTGGSAITPAAEVPAPSLNLDDLVFDVPTSAPAVKPAAAAPAATADKGMEFTLDFPSDVKPATPTTSAPVKDVGLSDISLNLDETAAPQTASAAENKDEQWQEVATKLDLAKAYQEMGDQAGAREILEEVLRDGDAAQKTSAQALLQQLS
jgi:pilus assembly protein FimV